MGALLRKFLRSLPLASEGDAPCRGRAEVDFPVGGTRVEGVLEEEDGGGRNVEPDAILAVAVPIAGDRDPAGLGETEADDDVRVSTRELVLQAEDASGRIVEADAVPA